MRSLIRSVLTVAVLSAPLAAFAAEETTSPPCVNCRDCCDRGQASAPAEPAPQEWRFPGTIDGNPGF
jgi:hypothetical protein